ncbi:MAG: hypothetical protein DI537_21220, partial [Stutzerimonas stutzeri]
TLGSVTTTASDLSVTSANAGITATSIDAAGDTTLTAGRSIAVADHLTTGGAATVAADRGRLDIIALTAGAGSTLKASDAMTLGSVTTTGGDLSVISTNAGIAAASITVAGDATLAARTAIAVTNQLISSGAARLDISDGTLDLANLVAGRSSTLTASGRVALGRAATDAGDLIVTSTGAGIVTTSISAEAGLTLRTQADLSAQLLAAGGTVRLAAGGSTTVGTVSGGQDLAVSAEGPIVVGRVSARSGEVSINSLGGSISVGAVDSAGAITGATAGDIAFGLVRSATDVLLASTAGLIQVETLISGRDVGLLARSIAFDRVDAGRSAALSANENIDGARLVATDALVLQAGRSGVGSITLGSGAARGSSFRAPDDIRLGRFGAGDSIVIRGTRIAADIVQLPGGAELPLRLDLAGLRERSAQGVDLRVDAGRFQAGRFEVVDGLLSTTSSDFGIAAAFVPGALQVTSPSMAILANNRGPAPVTGYDAQLYQRDRVFSLAVNGKRLTTSAFIIGFDADVVDAPSSISLGRDLARLGVVTPSGPSFGEIARGFVLGADGRWHSTTSDPETTASTGERSKPLVNLTGFEGQP